jgi:hypothetical protein
MSGNYAAGTSTDALNFGGQNTVVLATTQTWNGSAFTEVADLSTARFGGASPGLSTPGSADAICMGGGTSPAGGATTEEWTVAPPASFQQENLGQVFYNSTSNAFKVTKDNSGAPLGTWASGGNLNTARSSVGGAGIQTAALAFGGNPIPIALNESYNGTSWTEVNDLNTARAEIAGFGLQTAAVAAGGNIGSDSNATEIWDGTNWTTSPATLNLARRGPGGVGTTTAGLVFGGSDPGSTRRTQTESFNGTAWTELNDLNTAKWLPGSGGNQTAAIAITGDSAAFSGTVELWDGTSWTETTDINTTRIYGAGFGTQTSAIYTGGLQPGSPNFKSALTEFWNGSTWTEVADLATARNYIKSAQNSPSTLGLAIGGEGVPNATTAATEEWSAPAPFATNNTLTAS